MDAILFAINLEVMLLQMRILERRAERKFPENGVRNKRLKLVVEKLVRDRNIIKEISLRTLVELAEGGEWHTLKQAVDMLENNANSAISLRIKNENLKTCLDNVSTDLQRCRQQWKLNLRNYEIKIACLRDSIKDSVLNSRFQFEYVDKWLNARAESAELQVQENNTTPRPRIEYENCVHNELLRAYALQIKEREELLEYWKLRYAKDTSDLDMRLSEQCEKLRITVDRRGELESLFKLHAGEMRAWLTFKKERAARLLREERVRRAATRIQSWWRGLMVRRAIGSFRYLKNAKKAVPKAKKK